MNDLAVELNTANGPYFKTMASSIDVHTQDGSIHISPHEECHLSMIEATEITLQTKTGICVFIMENAVAGLKGQTLTVLAKSIRRVKPDAPSTSAALVAE